MHIDGRFRIILLLFLWIWLLFSLFCKKHGLATSHDSQHLTNIGNNFKSWKTQLKLIFIGVLEDSKRTIAVLTYLQVFASDNLWALSNHLISICYFLLHFSSIHIASIFLFVVFFVYWVLNPFVQLCTSLRQVCVVNCYCVF